MHSDLIEILGLKIQSYGLCMAMGFILCYWFARKLAKLSGRRPEEVDTLILMAAVTGVIGARIVFVAQNWATEFAANPMRIFAFWEGGLVFYGGLLLAIVAFIVYAKMKGERIFSLGDFCLVFVPLGHAFGRLGCFMHGCCYGALCGDSALGVCFPPRSPAFMNQVAQGVISPYALKALPVWPTQLFEAAGCLLLFGALWWVYRKWAKTLPGLTVACYTLGYALLRFVGECLRDDPRGATVLGMSFSQAISVGLAAFGLVVIGIILWEHRNGSKSA